MNHLMGAFILKKQRLVKRLLLLSFISNFVCNKIFLVHTFTFTVRKTTPTQSIRLTFHQNVSPLPLKRSGLLSTLIETTNVHINNSNGGMENSDRCTEGLTRDQEAYLLSLNPDIYGVTFLNKIHELLEFKNAHGSCSVPKRFKENPALGNWVNKTRQMYRKYLEGESTSMTPERLKVLNEIDFIWYGTLPPHASTNLNSNYIAGDDDIYNVENESTIQDKLWMNQYRGLKDYWSENKNSYANLKSSSQHASLSAWVVRQRREYHKMKAGDKSTMTQDRINLLDQIEFDWSPRDTSWNSRISELKAYKKYHGDCLVPIKYGRLGRWVSTQRKYYKMYKNGDKSRITKEKIKQLSDIGFVWNRWELSWSDNGRMN